MKPIISVRNLSKKYIIGENIHGRGARTFRDIFDHKMNRLFRRKRNRSKGDTTLWALKDVSFNVDPGEVVGIIGRNGAGKTTLLKILSRITEPTKGYVTLRGRVASLLEVGTGFSGELTGRENIFLNGSILGMKKKEIRQKFDEIVAFAEVQKFIDTPVKRYSSGMYVRLAFAVAAHLEPEILLVDEVLAVGDAEFQKKCLGKMEGVAREGRTVLFVSHNMAAVSSLCTRGMWISGGRLVSSGPTGQVIHEYLAQSQTLKTTSLADRPDRKGNGRIRFTAVSVLNHRGQVVEHVMSGEEITLSMEYNVPSGKIMDHAIVQVAFSGSYGQPLFVCLSRVTPDGAHTLKPRGRILCRIPRLPLLPGNYGYSLWCKIGEVMEDWILEAGGLSVVGGDYFGSGKLPPPQSGELLVDHRWSVE